MAVWYPRSCSSSDRRTASPMRVTSSVKYVPSSHSCRPVRKAERAGAHQALVRKLVSCTASAARPSRNGVCMMEEPPKPMSSKPRSSAMYTTMCGCFLILDASHLEALLESVAADTSAALAASSGSLCSEMGASAAPSTLCCSPLLPDTAATAHSMAKSAEGASRGASCQTQPRGQAVWCFYTFCDAWRPPPSVGR
eukprot:scaffold110192_cov48-Phaeocystis_antarctica.AAC.2